MKLVIKPTELYHGGPGSGRYPLGSGDRPHQHDGLYRLYNKYEKEADREIKKAVKSGDESLKTAASRLEYKSRYVSMKMKKHEQEQSSKQDNKQKESQKVPFSEEKGAVAATGQQTSNLAKRLSERTLDKNTKYIYKGSDRLNDMSDEEIRKALSRAKLEKEYTEYFTEKYVDPGKQRTAERLEKIGQYAITATNVVTTALTIAQLCAILRSKGKM